MPPTSVVPTPGGSPARRIVRAAQVIIVGSVMFTFISYWRTAAIVLNDLASTAYYIGGIAEDAIGKAAPWFILGVMLFSYAVRSVYIESCSLFVRGGVYRVVRSALGSVMAKIAVSALMFDYVLTGPISGVSAGQYIIGLALESLTLFNPAWQIADEVTRRNITNWGAVLIASGITLYFFRQNLLGIHESSDKALKIMIATTIMGAVMLVACGVTIAVRDRSQINRVPWHPELTPKVEYETREVEDPITGEKRETWVKGLSGQLLPKFDLETGQPVPKIDKATGHQQDPLGYMPRIFPGLAESLRGVQDWFTLIGVLGVLLAFGHSILAMSGEETLAQVYREVESPKLKNFKKAAFIVFIYSLALTATISFLAVLIIPDEVRMKYYKDNLIGGLAMYTIGPLWWRLILNALVTVVGFFILAGAANTSIIGSNGVLNRVAEDGVLPAWVQKPHPRYGTTYRLLYLIVGLQLITIVASQGDTIVLGEAYAFGVVWSFVFQAVSMVVLRFKDRRPREAKVPLNIRIGTVEVPIGLMIIMLILLMTALLNLMTKEVATQWGVTFTAVFFAVFTLTQWYYRRKRRGLAHEHVEQFQRETTEVVSPEALELRKPYHKLVAIRSPQNLFMLEKALAETDPETTDVIVMTAKVAPAGEMPTATPELDEYDQHLMTAVVGRAEKAGKHVTPMIVPTNNPLFAVIQTAKQLKAQELVVGASNKFTAEEQLDQMALYWMNMNAGQANPLTVRILGLDRDVYFDLDGGNRIPKITERKARSVAELRAAGVGVDRVLLIHDGTPENHDLFQAVLTMLDPEVVLTLAQPIQDVPAGQPPVTSEGTVFSDVERAKQLDRELDVRSVHGNIAEEIVKLAHDGQYDLIVLGLPSGTTLDEENDMMSRALYVARHATCRVFIAAPPALPQELEEQPKPPEPARA